MGPRATSSGDEDPRPAVVPPRVPPGTYHNVHTRTSSQNAACLSYSPPATRFRAHALLFTSLVPGLLALLALGLSAGGTAGDTIYRLVSALWVATSASFTVFCLRFRRANIATSDAIATMDQISKALVLALLPFTALLVANALFLGLFWPVFAAFFYQLATNAFYRLMFLDSH